MSQPTPTEIMAAIAALGDRMDRRFSILETKVDANTVAVAEIRGELRGLSSVPAVARRTIPVRPEPSPGVDSAYRR